MISRRERFVKKLTDPKREGPRIRANDVNPFDKPWYKKWYCVGRGTSEIETNTDEPDGQIIVLLLRLQRPI